jgi:hypothetical protein
MNSFLRKTCTYLLFIFAFVGLFFVAGYIAVRMGWTNTYGIIDEQNKSFVQPSDQDKNYKTFPLSHTKEWIAFRIAVTKDKAIIDTISKETGISGRLLVSLLVPEQMRLFHSNRALFEKIFEPLKILGNQSQFSWGIFGIKDDTARKIEEHLKNKNSPFYLGSSFEHMLDFKTSDTGEERFQRIIDEDDHTYSYLYSALYLAQINKQWEDAGFPINDRPEILATLFNLGFEKSVPKSNPKSDGSAIDINGTLYSFGDLAGEFYYSDEMIELFPQE